MNIYDISQKTGVSTATVSRVINGSSSVSEKTRQKVLDAIEEYGYTPNVFARGLGLNTMKTVGVLCADSSDPYLAQAVYCVEEHLRKSGYDVILSCTGYDHAEKERGMESLLSKRVDAVILVGSNYVENTDELNMYIIKSAKTVPVMIINGSINVPNVYCTVCDDYSAIYEITEKMIAAGRKSPLYIYNSESYSGIRKLTGFKDALTRNGIKFGDNNILFVGSRKPGGRTFPVNIVKNAVAKLAADGHFFDCAIASDDILAAGAVKYAHEAGLKIPEDFAVAGYNNFDLCECCEPELTSVDNHLDVLCDHCVSSLMSIFSGQDAAIPKHTVFSGEIVERGTTDFGSK